MDEVDGERRVRLNSETLRPIHVLSNVVFTWNKGFTLLSYCTITFFKFFVAFFFERSPLFSSLFYILTVVFISNSDFTLKSFAFLFEKVDIGCFLVLKSNDSLLRASDLGPFVRVRIGTKSGSGSINKPKIVPENCKCKYKKNIYFALSTLNFHVYYLPVTVLYSSGSSKT